MILRQWVQKISIWENQWFICRYEYWTGHWPYWQTRVISEKTEDWAGDTWCNRNASSSRKITKVERKLSFLDELSQGFQCVICKSTAKTPVSPCCQRVVGCESCVNNWVSSQSQESRCPLCSTSGGMLNGFALKGFNDALKIIVLPKKFLLQHNLTQTLILRTHSPCSGVLLMTRIQSKVTFARTHIMYIHSVHPPH